MSRARPLTAIGLAAAALAAAVLAAALLRGGGSAQGGPSLPAGVAIGARTTLSPREIYFGDSVLARVDVAIDRDRIDPDTVGLKAVFAPYRPVGPVRRVRKDAAHLSTVSFEATLRCLEVRCLPKRVGSIVTPHPARIDYSGAAGDRALRVSWPSLTVAPRIDSSTGGSLDAEQLAAWRAQYVAPPRVSYRISPVGLEALLGVCGVLLVLGGAGVLIYRVAGTPTIVEHWRTARLPPLERALRMLESPALAPASPARRRALDVLVVELARSGEPGMAFEARTLAWTDAAPPVGDTRRLVADVRTLLHDRENGSE